MKTKNIIIYWMVSFSIGAILGLSLGYIFSTEVKMEGNENLELLIRDDLSGLKDIKVQIKIHNDTHVYNPNTYEWMETDENGLLSFGNKSRKRVPMIKLN